MITSLTHVVYVHFGRANRGMGDEFPVLSSGRLDRDLIPSLKANHALLPIYIIDDKEYLECSEEIDSIILAIIYYDDCKIKDDTWIEVDGTRYVSVDFIDGRSTAEQD